MNEDEKLDIETILSGPIKPPTHEERRAWLLKELRYRRRIYSNPMVGYRSGGEKILGKKRSYKDATYYFRRHKFHDLQKILINIPALNSCEHEKLKHLFWIEDQDLVEILYGTDFKDYKFATSNMSSVCRVFDECNSNLSVEDVGKRINEVIEPVTWRPPEWDINKHDILSWIEYWRRKKQTKVQNKEILKQLRLDIYF